MAKPAAMQGGAWGGALTRSGKGGRLSRGRVWAGNLQPPRASTLTRVTATLEDWDGDSPVMTEVNEIALGSYKPVSIICKSSASALSGCCACASAEMTVLNETSSGGGRGGDAAVSTDAPSDCRIIDVSSCTAVLKLPVAAWHRIAILHAAVLGWMPSCCIRANHASAASGGPIRHMRTSTCHGCDRSPHALKLANRGSQMVDDTSPVRVCPDGSVPARLTL